ncbi:uncharacterized protein LOC132554923 [Ylistrum balloti]|uniref:uncharacterized protein LOC132554923 n=1 Tax=Ylistrum balloti TaxID=509963 RepID=UPI002905F72D|nr:uncharacterized protein LOC132554923 [Ylistrum balloti]
MEYFTRQITLQDRLKQHECQLYPLFGSCLELRDDSPPGRYQAGPLDLSFNRMTPTDTFSSDESGKFVPTGRISSSEGGTRVTTDTSSSPEGGTLVTTDTPSSPEGCTLVTTVTSPSPEGGTLVTIDTSSSPEGGTLVTTDTSSSPKCGTLVITDKSSSPEGGTLVTTDTSSSPEGGTLVTTVTSPSPEGSTLVTTDTSSSLEGGTLVTTVTSPSPEGGTLVTIDTSSSPEGGTLVSTDRPSSTKFGTLVSTSTPSSPVGDTLVPTGTSSKPEDDTSVSIDRPSSSKRDTLLPIGTSSSAESGTLVPNVVSLIQKPGEACGLQPIEKFPESENAEFDHNSDLHTAHSSLISNDGKKGELITRNTKCSLENTSRLEEQTQDTILTRARVQCDNIIDRSNPLLKEVLESGESTVSTLYTKDKHQNTQKVLHQDEHNDPSLHRDHEDSRSESVINNEHKQHFSTLNDDHESKRSDSAMTKEYISTIAEGHVSMHCNLPTANDDIPVTINTTTCDVSCSNQEKTFKTKYSRKRRRRLAFLASGKRQNELMICPNINVRDFTEQFTNDRCRYHSVRESNHPQHPLTNYSQRNIDVNPSGSWVEENQEQMPSHDHINQLSMPSNLSHSMNTPVLDKSEAFFPTANRTLKHSVPPPLTSVKNYQSESRPDRNLYCPGSSLNVVTHDLMTDSSTWSNYQRQQRERQYCQQPVKQTLHSSEAPDKHSVCPTAPLDMTAKRSKEHKSPAGKSSSISEEARIKEISDNLRAQLLGQLSNVPHSCPGVCLGHSVGSLHNDKTPKCIPSPRQPKRFSNINQTSIIIDRQLLLNLDYQQLLNTDRETTPKVDQGLSSNESVTSDTDRLHKCNSFRSDERHGSNSADPTDAQNRDYSNSPDGNRPSDHQRSPNDTTSQGGDRNTLPMITARDEIVTSVSTHVDTNGSTCSRSSRLMAWNLSVSKTIGLHSDCNNCKACRRIFARLSIPPIEEPHTPTKQTKIK